MKAKKPKAPTPRLHTRKLSGAGRSLYGMNSNKTPKFEPETDQSRKKNLAAFPMKNLAFPGGNK